MLQYWYVDVIARYRIDLDLTFVECVNLDVLDGDGNIVNALQKQKASQC